MKLNDYLHDLVKLFISFTPLSGAIQFYRTLKKWINGANTPTILVKEVKENGV